MAKSIPTRWQNEGAIAYIRRLIAEIPKMSMTRAKAIAAGTRRLHSSRFKRHQGPKECERRLKQKQFHNLLATQK